MYYAVKLTTSYYDWEGAVATKNSMLSILNEQTFNIRVSDLTQAFNKTDMFAVFDDEEKALEYLSKHQCFGTVSTIASGSK